MTHMETSVLLNPQTHLLTRYEYNTIGWKVAEVSPKTFRTEYDYDNNADCCGQHLTEEKQRGSYTMLWDR